jgi:hypothetical protein
MEVAIDIDAPAEAVWNLLVDTGRWPEWGPSVLAVDCRERLIRAGTVGRLRTPRGIWIPFVITDFDAPRLWRWRVAGMPATGHRIESLDAERTRLVFELPAIAFPYAAVCRLAGRRIARLIATGPHRGKEGRR